MIVAFCPRAGRKIGKSKPKGMVRLRGMDDVDGSFARLSRDCLSLAVKKGEISPSLFSASPPPPPPTCSFGAFCDPAIPPID